MSMKDVPATLGGQQTGVAQFSGRRKVPRSKGTSLHDVPKKQQRTGEGEATGDTDADVTDLVAQVHLKLSAQLESRVRDLESATYCTLPSQRERHRERDARRSQRKLRVGNNPFRKKRTLAHLVLSLQC